MADMFTAIKGGAYDLYKSTATQFVPVLAESKFLQEGVLTPEEFVAAGDLLVYKCPTWQWSSGEKAKQVAYLPAEKQFLLTNGVICKARFRDDSAKSETVDDDWTSVAAQVHAEAVEEIPDAEVNKTPYVPKPLEDEDMDAIPDMDGFDASSAAVIDEDVATAKTKIQKTRTYDLALTYDKYERTPVLWLFGRNEQGQPLKPDEIFMDISDDHAKKTVTVATHPHLPSAWTYIHPCRHASVMKKFVQRMIDKGLQPRGDQYLLLFLKFMGAVIPTISYDNTFDIGL